MCRGFEISYLTLFQIFAVLLTTCLLYTCDIPQVVTSKDEHFFTTCASNKSRNDGPISNYPTVFYTNHLIYLDPMRCFD